MSVFLGFMNLGGGSEKRKTLIRSFKRVGANGSVSTVLKISLPFINIVKVILYLLILKYNICIVFFLPPEMGGWEPLPPYVWLGT